MNPPSNVNPVLTAPPTAAPALWNPNAAACWSLLFTPAFGAYLHARNAEALGRTDEAKANRMVFFIVLGYQVVALLSVFVPAIRGSIFTFIGFCLLLGWYLGLGKKQLAYVKTNWQNNYPRKPWTVPLLIGFGYLGGVFILTALIALVMGAATSGH